MSRTFRYRQEWIRSCDGELNVAEVFEEYPMLKDNNYVSDYLLHWRAKFKIFISLFPSQTGVDQLAHHF